MMALDAATATATATAAAAVFTKPLGDNVPGFLSFSAFIDPGHTAG